MKTKRQHTIFHVHLSWSDLDDLVKAQLLWTNDLNEAEIGGLSTPREAARRDQGDSTSPGADDANAFLPRGLQCRDWTNLRP